MTFPHWIGNSFRALLERVPLSTARWLFIAQFLILMFWIVQLPSAETSPTDRQSRWYEDLRIWAWLTLIFQIVIYSVF